MSQHRSQGLLGECDRTEVVTTDDMAARRADEHLALAMLDQQARAKTGPTSAPGICAYCARRCLPRAVYCDAECRADHEAELATLARLGRAP